MSLEQEMMFANFSEKLKGWYNKYECANEYRKCKEESLQEENFNERRIGSLRYLKEVNKIEAMFYILTSDEKEQTEELIEQIYKEEFDEQNNHMDWNQLLLILASVSENRAKQLAKQFLGGFENDPVRTPQWLGDRMANTINYNFDTIEKDYFTIIKIIYDALQENDFLDSLEHRLKILENKQNKKKRFEYLPKEKLEDYYLFLCENGAYEAANSFLDRIWKEDDDEKLFDKEPDELKEIIYCWPSPSLLGFGKGYMQNYINEYCGQQWVADIDATKKKPGSDEQWKSVYKWIEVCNKVENLYVERNEENINKLSEVDMFDVYEYSYMTQLCCQMAEIIQDWLFNLKETELVEKLRLLGDKNIFSYKLYDWYTYSYRSYKKLKKTIEWTALLDKLKTMESVENIIYVFFNSPIWLNVDFFDFVKVVNEKKDRSEKIEKLFEEYIIKCLIVDEDKKTSTGSQRFSIVPRYLFWTIISADRTKNKIEYKHYLRITPKWLNMNSTKINLQKEEGKDTYIPQPYDFKLYEFKNEVLYIIDDEYEKSPEDENNFAVRKNNFLTNLDKWFEYGFCNKQFIKWEELIETETLKIKERPFSMEERVQVAEKLLDLVIALAKENPEEIWELLRCCSFRPMENINEFRYIAEQHWTDFELTKEQEKTIHEKAKYIFEEINLPADLKLEIYMNTCAKKVYLLEELLKLDGIGELLFRENTEWVVPVKFEGHSITGTEFSMKSVMRKDEVDSKKQYIIKTNCSFYYENKIGIPEEKLPKRTIKDGRYGEKLVPINPKGRFVMYATMDSIDDDNRIKLKKYFFDSEEVKQYFPWKEYKKCLYDLKELEVGAKQKNAALYLNVFEVLDTLNAKTLLDSKGKVTSYAKCQQFVCELDEVLRTIKYDIRMSYEILLFLGHKNLFWDKMYQRRISDDELNEIKVFAKERCANSFEYFLRAINGNSVFYLATIYNLSHMNLLVEKDEFVSVLANELGLTTDKIYSEFDSWKDRVVLQVEKKHESMQESLEEKRQKKCENVI